MYETRRKQNPGKSHDRVCRANPRQETSIPIMRPRRKQRRAMSQIADFFDGDRQQREGARQDLVQASARRDARHRREPSRTASTARTTSGPTCTLASPKRPRRRAWTISPILFEAVGQIEKEHEERYRKLLANLESGKVFQREEPNGLEVRSTAATSITVTRPPRCARDCSRPKAYFQMRAQNY